MFYRLGVPWKGTGFMMLHLRRDGRTLRCARSYRTKASPVYWIALSGFAA